jgi:cbb3-type cytochrome oxidase subunit 3
MGYRGWKRFLQTFRGEHDFGAFFFFTFVSLVYWVFAPATKRGAYAYVNRGPNRVL